MEIKNFKNFNQVNENIEKEGKDLYCPECGSNNVVADAFAEWNPKTQAFDSLYAVYDDQMCDTCGEHIQGVFEEDLTVPKKED